MIFKAALFLGLVLGNTKARAWTQSGINVPGAFCLPACLFLCLNVCLFVCLFVCLLVCLLFVCLFDGMKHRGKSLDSLVSQLLQICQMYLSQIAKCIFLMALDKLMTASVLRLLLTKH